MWGIPKKEQKDKNLSEDDLKKNSNEVQKITDLKIAEIDKKTKGYLHRWRSKLYT